MHRLDLAGGEAELVSHRLQQGEVATAAVAEAELRTDPHFVRLQSADQQRADEVLGRPRGQLGVEAQQADMVGAEGQQAFHLGPCQGEPRRRVVPCEELARQRFERDHHGRHAQGTGTRNGMAHQRTVARMQAIEGADADHATVRAQRPAIDVTEQPAHGILSGAERPVGAIRRRCNNPEV